MNKLLMTTAILAAIGTTPAHARLQLSISVGASTFTCFDGELSCDLSGAANNLLTVDQTVGGVFVQLTLAQSAFGHPDELQLSSSNILNNNRVPVIVSILASDTSFSTPVSAIRSSASLTFNNAVGSGLSSLSFRADHANVQGANPSNTPGTLLEQVFGIPITNPDSFSGSKTDAFSALSPFSMTEGGRLQLIAGGSVTGFNQAMESTTIPETSTWAMLCAGFGFMALLAGWRRKRVNRFAF